LFGREKQLLQFRNWRTVGEATAARTGQWDMKILLAVDDSKFSEAALQAVLAQARPQDAEVRVLHVLEPPSLLLGREMGGYDPEFEAVWKALREQAKALVEKITGKLRASGFSVTPSLEEGDPTSKIIDAAKEWNADLIVLGSHGRKGLERFLMGSVADSVARHANCSVEIVRIPSAR
jgi:universal stress protein A